jgi:ABC-type dipeptide/oligopeptide/nickel transport system permease subunit
MSEASLSPVALPKATPRVSEFRRVYRVMASRGVVVFGAIVILVFISVALSAPWLAPYDPLEQNLRARLQQPSTAHLLGTDEMGRDTMSRIIYGSRISLMVGIIVVTVAGVIGMFMGLAAGYFGGWTNALIMRFNDALMSLPPIVLMLALCAALGGGLMSILISVGIVLAPTYCRLMCGQILTLKNSDFVTAARVIGAHDLRIMVRHLLPNAFPPLLVLITINLGTAIMFEATLSFLGIGIRPPTATWGNMVMDGYRFLLKNPILSFAPGLSITLLVLGFNLVGDGLRDALDPRLRGTI